MSEIQPDEPRSWRGRIFVTFDVDFASDEVLAEAVRFVADRGVPATWFATHATKVLDEIRAQPSLELGIHPDFERLLWSGAGRRGDAVTILDRLLAVVPEARVARSHCLTSSSFLSLLLADRGIELESNLYLPFDSGMASRPWRHFSGLAQAPFGWLDDVAIRTRSMRPCSSLVRRGSLNVFVFHPIHIVANTATVRQMDRILDVLRSPLADVRRALSRTRRPPGSLGARDQLEDLLSLMG